MKIEITLIDALNVSAKNHGYGTFDNFLSITKVSSKDVRAIIDEANELMTSCDWGLDDNIDNVSNVIDLFRSWDNDWRYYYRNRGDMPILAPKGKKQFILYISKKYEIRKRI